MRAVAGLVVMLVLVIFGLSNRGPVDISFWPFGTVTVRWLGLLVLVVFGAGFLLGLLFHLPRRFASSRRAKRAEKRVAELEARQTTLPPAP